MLANLVYTISIDGGAGCVNLKVGKERAEFGDVAFVASVCLGPVCRQSCRQMRRTGYPEPALNKRLQQSHHCSKSKLSFPNLQVHAARATIYANSTSIDKILPSSPVLPSMLLDEIPRCSLTRRLGATVTTTMLP